MASERVGILGGTFDPIHYGHLIPAEYAFDHLGLDRLLVIPAADPVHRPRHRPAAAEHRLAMCRLAAGPIPGFEVSDIEIARPEPSYTVLTLEELRRRPGPDASLFLLIGDDNLPSLHTWYRVRDIVRLATVAPLPRGGTDLPDELPELADAIGQAEAEAIRRRRVPGPALAVSGTEIRRRVAAGEPIDGLVPEAVATYVAEHGLYRGGEAGQ